MKIITVLGSPNKNSGELYDVAIHRCELTIEEFIKDTAQKIIVTGGFGQHFNTSALPHATYLKNYLLEHGIPENSILGMAKSTNTIEDALLTKEITDMYQVSLLKIVTSDYHVDRAKFVFEHFYRYRHIPLQILGAITNEKNSELDIRILKQHELNALEKLKSLGIENYYS